MPLTGCLFILNLVMTCLHRNMDLSSKLAQNSGQLEHSEIAVLIKGLQTILRSHSKQELNLQSLRIPLLPTDWEDWVPIALCYYRKTSICGQWPIQPFEMLEKYFWEHMLRECWGDVSYPLLTRPQSGNLLFDFDKIVRIDGNDLEASNYWGLKKFRDGEFDVANGSDLGTDSDKLKYSDSQSEEEDYWKLTFFFSSVLFRFGYIMLHFTRMTLHLFSLLMLPCTCFIHAPTFFSVLAGFSLWK